MSEKPKYTVKDYDNLPEGSPYQLIGGELIMTPAPVPYHQRIVLNLGIILKNYLSNYNFGEIYISPIDVYFSDTESYQPDLIFISKDKLHIIGEKKIEGVPHLVIEILSESTAYYDLVKKKNVYESSGVKEYWIVDPIEKSIEVYENAGNEFRLYMKAKMEEKINSKLIQGFEVELKDIF